MFVRILYRCYRSLKLFFLINPRFPGGKLFFLCITYMDQIMSSRKKNKIDKLYDDIWKAIYFYKYSEPPFHCETLKTIAYDSHDHQWPRGSLFDNSANRRFNLKVYDYFNHQKDISLLDLGCSGGALVKSFLEDGYIGVGVEGSDISMRLHSGEWDTIPYHLFTADITEPFTISATQKSDEMRGGQFHVITAWDVLEHIPENKLIGCIYNIKKHLRQDGVFIASIDLLPDGNPFGPEGPIIYHNTLWPQDRWLHLFKMHGFEEVNDHHFTVSDFVRGNGLSFKDWSPPKDGFHVILRLSRSI